MRTQTFTFPIDRAWGFISPETPERDPHQPAYIHTLVSKPHPATPFVVRSVIYRTGLGRLDTKLDEFCDRMNLPHDDRSTVSLDFIFPDLSKVRHGTQLEDRPLNPLMVATARQRRFSRYNDQDLVTAQVNFSGRGYVMPHLPGNAEDAAVYSFNLHPMDGHFDPSGQQVGKIHIEA